MISRFTEYVREHHLFLPSDRVLLTVSGGVDSMVMWKLFELAGFPFSVAHCNFKLRGDESDGDEALVRELAGKTKTRLFVRKFETREVARERGISVEMAARELRYEWFEQIRTDEDFSYIATAHHQDDLLETFFINLTRKTGIKGLTGFREKSGFIIRPMLFTGRKEIMEWALKNSVQFRHDSTNSELVFQRNFIRHSIIPKFEELNPAFRNNLSETIRNLRAVEDFYLSGINRQIMKACESVPGGESLLLSTLLRFPHPRQVLFEWMSRFGFNPATADAVFSNLEKEPGRRYFSKTHRLVTARNKLVITSLPEERKQLLFYIEKEDREIAEPVHLYLEPADAKEFRIIPDPHTACLDAANLSFPLMIRKWEPGDYFQPFGMTGFKKISDYFIDEKFSLPEKEDTWLLFSAGKVVWIIGQRIDNRYRITPETKEVMVINYIR